MFRHLTATLRRHHNNFRGWCTARKLIVIESDDWGSICMPSRKVYEKLLEKGIRVDRNPYTRYDALATPKDLEQLYSVLSSFSDLNGRSPVITANAVTANPDFKKIEANGYREYRYEWFTETLKQSPDHLESFDYWKRGMDQKLFYPQFHGREHLNPKVWMDRLQKEDSPLRSVFSDGVPWLGPGASGEKQVSIRAAFDAESAADIERHRQALSEGLELFRELFGYPSKSFIAPNFVFPPCLDRVLAENGIEYVQGMKYRKLPIQENRKREMVRRWQGEQTGAGLRNLVRNCEFEPSQHPFNYDSVSECLKGIQNAFLWRKPAIITAHRLNFIGYIDPENRERNLKKLRELLQRILNTWPDTEFLTSVELGDMIAGGR